MIRKKKAGRRARQLRAVTSPEPLIEALPNGPETYRRGVETGINWAEGVAPQAAATYAPIKHADVVVALWRTESMLDQTESIVAFTGLFQPPGDYEDQGLPDGAIGETELETVLYWMAWLDGVQEVLARYELAQLLAPARGRRILAMDRPRSGECPVCWIERNLGVKVVICDQQEGGEARTL
ncbi:MAG TPA: hypothetical protein VHK65_06220 [Candidatus Dormibacteraeota bacterium]|nr:hypothetical protein [Candidatus Dormibacteraeota bacterium]